MIIVRTVFQAEWNKAGELAHAMHQSVEGMTRPAGAGHWRVLTDLSGPFNTVVLEVEVESLAVWEQGRGAMFADPQWQQGMTQMTGLIVSGHQEFYTLEAQG
jgi:hypothetical protein